MPAGNESIPGASPSLAQTVVARPLHVGGMAIDRNRQIFTLRAAGEGPSGRPTDMSEQPTTATEIPMPTPAEADAPVETRLAAALARETAAQEKLQEMQDRLLRTAAEFENARRRMAREREETVKSGNERLLRDFLPVVDNLERALAVPGEAGPLRDGVKLVLKLFQDTLERAGVKAVSAVGQPFDPNLHEAIMQQESVEAPENQVLAEVAKGYTLNDRLIRPASVVVARAPSASA